MSAKGWINTDRIAVRADIDRLGLKAAAEYQMELIAECTADGDDRWQDVTLNDMIEAIEELHIEGSYAP